MVPATYYRRGTHSDVAAMSLIRAANWGSKEYWRERISGYMDCTRHPQKALDPRIIFVAEENRRVIGFIAGHLTQRFDCDGELEWIDVIKDRRRSGVASQLLQHLANWFVEQNAKRVCVDVQPENTPARNFYRRHGAVDLNTHWLVWPDISTTLISAPSRENAEP